jgi:uncharacterized protein YwgA
VFFLSQTRSKTSNLRALLELSGVDVSQITKRFSTRLESQKKVFLLQLHPKMSGMLGYSFNMYVRGPYSPPLASAYYGLEQVEPANVAIDDSARMYIAEVSTLDNWNLELLTTTFSVLEYGKKASNDSIVTTVKNLKPKYTRDEIERAIRRARELMARYELRV